MSKVVVAVRDLKASAFLHPHFQVSKGVAIRSFSDAVHDKQSMISQHPQDYQLYLLGELDEASGHLTALELPELLCSAIDFVTA